MADRKHQELFDHGGDGATDEGGGQGGSTGFEDEIFNTEVHELIGDLGAEGAQPVESPELPTPSVAKKETLPPPPVPAAAPPPEQRYQSARRLSRWWLYIPLLLATLAAGGYAAWIFAVQPWIEREPPEVDLGPLGLTVDSVPPGATVWLQIGQAPTTSPVVSAGARHRLRILHPSHPPRVVEVRPADFEERGDARVARLRVDLASSGGGRSEEAAEEGAEATPRGGRGRIEVETAPAGALVWLEIGTTPNARLSGLESWEDRELLIQKEEHAPKTLKLRPRLFGESGWGHVRARLEPAEIP